MKTLASQPAPVERELTDAECAVVEQYSQRFGYPAYPPLDYGHCYVTDEEMLAYAREGFAQGAAIDWSKYYAPLPDGAVS